MRRSMMRVSDAWAAARRFGLALLAALLLLSSLPQVRMPAAQAASPLPPEPIFEHTQPITLAVRTPGFLLDAQGLRVEGYDAEDRPGAPRLPVWRTAVELPADGVWHVTYESTGSRTMPLAAPLPAVPVPETDLLTPGGQPNPDDLPPALPLADRPDPAIYGRDAFYPAEPVQAGPVQIQRGQRLLPLRVYPFQYDPVAGSLRYHPDIRITISAASGPGQEDARTDRSGGSTAETAWAGATEPGRAGFSDPPPDPAASAPGALRIRTGERGLYRLTYDDLVRAGVPVTATDPASLAMSYLGEPIAIEVTGAADGRLDPGDRVVFYAEPYVGRYMTGNVYWLTFGGDTPGLRMAGRAVQPAGGEPVVTTITRTLHVEVDRTYYSTYHLPPDADHWFDEPLYANEYSPAVTVTYDLPLDDPVPDGELLLRASLHGGAARSIDPDQSVEMRLNNRPAGLFRWDGSVTYVATATVPAAWLAPSGNRLSLTAALDQLPGLDGYWVSPDWVEVTYPARANARGDRLYVEGVAAGPRELVATGFTTSAVAAYDVSDGRHPLHLPEIAVQPDGDRFAVHLWDDLPGRSYALSADAALLAPLAVERDTPSSWRTADHAADYIAIVHRSLWDAIRPLLDHRAAEGLRVAKVDVQDVYDEFSAGRVDPEAIHGFLAHAYRAWNAGGSPPSYILLVGDGHYDFKGVSRPDLPNLIPPYLLDVDPWIGETATDNRYVCVDGPDDLLPDMHIGRIPARTPAETAAAVAKILVYETSAPRGDWQRRVVYVADSATDPAGNFHRLSDEVRLNWLPPEYQGRPVYYRMDAGHDTAEEMRQAIRRAFDEGAVLLQWFGHASRQRWGSVSMFDVLDPPRLGQSTGLPVTLSFTCWSGYFINIQGSRQYNNNEQTVGEVLLLTPGRGSVADLSPSGLHIGEALLTLDKGITEAIFRDRVNRIGPAIDAGKRFFYARTDAWHDIIDTSVLFGDPATKVRLPALPYYLPVILA